MTEARNIAIKTVTAHQQPEIDYCYAVRRAVFVEEQRVPMEIEMDDKDETATHILATLNGAAIGAARIVFLGDVPPLLPSGNGRTTVGKIGRVCVLPTHRGRGIGRQIVLFAVEEIKRMIGSGSGGKVQLGAQCHAMTFYESMGFEVIPGGEEYMDAGGVPHRDMQMML
eukprot:CAMPEP_0172496484 /NCGR_PEP_ID=MMETSP1066-20121228/87997_1 /TAXON_ID=671091 /ORGANISM="Coscinodiscus wailesii, Strain CCMP2513" /LENGTH=168 /DNA_ID=CAMNT_0013268807 /DNA_START=139 /DNA_END=645 /DNA_ORIENTATION=-